VDETRRRYVSTGELDLSRGNVHPGNVEGFRESVSEWDSGAAADVKDACARPKMVVENVEPSRELVLARLLGSPVEITLSDLIVCVGDYAFGVFHSGVASQLKSVVPPGTGERLMLASAGAAHKHWGMYETCLPRSVARLCGGRNSLRTAEAVYQTP
jgi:hypothetical protein